jgi:hypothetical protein
MGDNTRPRMNPEEIEALLRKGFSQTEVAASLGLTRQAVSHQVRYGGGRVRTERYMTGRQEARRFWPFPDSTPDQNRQQVAKRLVDHAEWVSPTRSTELSAYKQYRLMLFYRKLRLDGLVVEFDPATPPHKGMPFGGFRFVPREESDGDSIIRVNQYTELTAESEEVWQFPPTMPGDLNAESED